MFLLLACAPGPISLGDSPEMEGQAVELPHGNADWYVDPAGDFEQIQDAVDAAESGDWILVSPGTYRESIDFGGKTLWITSRDGAAATILDGNGGVATVVAQNGEASGTGLAGFTVSGGSQAAVYVDFSTLHLEDVVISDATGNYAIYGSAADIELSHVTVENNREGYASVMMDRGVLQVSDSSITCGRSSYGIYHGHGYMQVDRTNLSCSRGYTIYSEHTTGSVIRSTLTGSMYVENEDDHYDDTIGLTNSVLIGNYQALYGTILIRNSLVKGGVSFTQFAEAPGTPLLENSIFTGANCTITSDGTMTIRNNSFWDSVPSCAAQEIVGVDGNIEGDPKLVDFSRGDYHLTTGSPLTDAGVDEDSYDDIDGSRNDIGVFGGHFSMDGGW